MASESNGMMSSTNLVDELEEAFLGLINGFTKEDGLSHGHDKRDELRTDAEQNVAKFIELAKQLETFFLQRRFQLSVLKPEQIIKEDCAELKQEIVRKDELIKKHYDKISMWLAMVGEPPASQATSHGPPNVPPISVDGPPPLQQMPQQPQQMQPQMQQQQPQPSQQQPMMPFQQR